MDRGGNAKFKARIDFKVMPHPNIIKNTKQVRDIWRHSIFAFCTVLTHENVSLLKHVRLTLKEALQTHQVAFHSPFCLIYIYKFFHFSQTWHSSLKLSSLLSTSSKRKALTKKNTWISYHSILHSVSWVCCILFISHGNISEVHFVCVSAYTVQYDSMFSHICLFIFEDLRIQIELVNIFVPPCQWEGSSVHMCASVDVCVCACVARGGLAAYWTPYQL